MQESIEKKLMKLVSMGSTITMHPGGVSVKGPEVFVPYTENMAPEGLFEDLNLFEGSAPGRSIWTEQAPAKFDEAGNPCGLLVSVGIEFGESQGIGWSVSVSLKILERFWDVVSEYSE